MDYMQSHGILQARVLEWVAIPFFRGSSQPRDWPQVSSITGGLFTSWATRQALNNKDKGENFIILQHIAKLAHTKLSRLEYYVQLKESGNEIWGPPGDITFEIRSQTWWRQSIGTETLNGSHLHWKEMYTKQEFPNLFRS